MLKSILSAKKARRSRDRSCLHLKNYLNAAVSGPVPSYATCKGQLRLSVHRSSKHIYAQVIDDHCRVSLWQQLRHLMPISNQHQARQPMSPQQRAVGKLVAERAKAKGIDAVVFDRGGYIFHGRVKALAEAAREAGLKF